MKRMVLLLALILILPGCNPGPPTARGGPAFDGSARWALNIAQPLITGFAADAQLYHILGSMIMFDGRLPTNQGDWSFVTWSPSQQKIFQVTVRADGTTGTNTSNQATAPTTGSGQPLPATWANSTVVFAAAVPHIHGGPSYAQLVVFNTGSNSLAPHEAVWGINNGAANYWVKWDGTYLGP